MSFQRPGGGGEGEALRVAVIADDPLAGSALERLLGEAGAVEVLAAAIDADVILWDSGLDGAEVPRRLATLAVPVVALVADARAASAAIAAGLRGAVARDASAERIVAALLAASRDLVVIDAAWVDAFVPAPEIAEDALAEPLTPREREVLELVAAGLSNRRIAKRLGISEHTAKFHVNAILAKLDASTRTEAVVVAARRGVLML